MAFDQEALKKWQLRCASLCLTEQFVSVEKGREQFRFGQSSPESSSPLLRLASAGWPN